MMTRKNTVLSAAEERPGDELDLVVDNDDAVVDRLRFGVWLKNQREELGLAQHELAARAGMTRGLISAYERGRIGVPTADRRRALAEAFEANRRITAAIQDA